MKTPKTLTGYLKMLIAIASDTSYDLKGANELDRKFISYIRAAIQNELGEDEFGTMKSNGMKW
jgi:hypothetical protein